MSLLPLRFPPLHLHSKTLIPHTADPPPARLLFRMKDRPPSSCGGIYVPPHQRFPSSNTATTASVPNDSKPMNVTTQCDAEKRELFSSVRVTSNGNSEAAKSYPYLPPHHYQKQVQQQKEHSGREEVAQQVSDRQVVFSAQAGALSSDNANAWEWRLNALLHDKDKQEVVSREKKDRRDFDQIAAVASRMGLYSHLYTKVVVVSKFPLPHYRFDLDDKRPQREVIMAPGLQKRVDAYLVNYISGKRKSMDAMSRSSSSNGSIATDDSLFEQPEPPPHSKTSMEKIFWRRSMEMYEKQRSWQESPEGRNMMEFRRSLPAYKEKDAMLSAISLNQVVLISGETGCGKTTQITQLILESEIDSLRGGMCNIICTQPRKISAMSVSERIATERGEKLGETIGYKVRLEGMKGRDTHLLFCTTGILLRRLSLDRSLKTVTHIIVDEIHERGINEDFLLIVLKDLLPRRPELKLVLMSATLDEKLFSSYFSGAPRLHIPVSLYDIEEATSTAFDIIIDHKMIKSETRLSLVKFFQLLVVHHPSRRCRKGTAEILVDFDNISVNKKETESGVEKGEPRHYDICGKDVPRGYWMFCRGSKNETRGFSCGLWVLFHSLSVRVDDGESEFAFSAICDFVHNFFVCEECRQHFYRMCSSVSSPFKKSRDFALWLWTTHNKVNERLMKEEASLGTGDPEFQKISWPPRQLCPFCYVSKSRKDSNKIEWDHDEVYKFLKGYYGKALVTLYKEKELLVEKRSVGLLAEDLTASTSVNALVVPLGAALAIAIASCVFGALACYWRQHQKSRKYKYLHSLKDI